MAGTGRGVDWFRAGERVGIPWLSYTCARCRYCTAGQENLCDAARFTGYQIDGGYAEYAVADTRYCFPIRGSYADHEAAPLLCAGLIGYRALCMAGEGERLGIYGFGAAAYRRSGGKTRGPAGVRLHPGGRPRGAGVRARAWRVIGPAAQRSSRPRSWTPRSSSPRWAR